MRAVPIALLFFLLVSSPAFAHRNDTFGWDLTYTSVLERNNVPRTEWIWRWLTDYRTPAESWVVNRQPETIISSILIEYPAFHAAEHTTMWLFRTGNTAYYWESVRGQKDHSEEPVKPEIYDALSKTISTWEQLAPKSSTELPKNALPGYFGFLSTFDKNGSRQMLLTVEDFLCVDPKLRCEVGKGNGLAGRLMGALSPILISEEERSYKHKTEAEIARMTPEQRIDEQIKEDDYHALPLDGQRELIEKYRRQDGIRAWAHLIDLIDSYNPKRPRDTRDSAAVRMAERIDEDIVRLRSSREGLQILVAIERLSARMRAAGQDDQAVRWAISSISGVNATDQAIADTLWVKYRIKISDSELLAVSNYLTEREPAYPSWSGTDFIKDDSRKNKAGFPSQVYVLKKPARYYQMYRAYRRHLRKGEPR